MTSRRMPSPGRKYLFSLVARPILAGGYGETEEDGDELTCRETTGDLLTGPEYE